MKFQNPCFNASVKTLLSITISIASMSAHAAPQSSTGTAVSRPAAANLQASSLPSKLPAKLPAKKASAEIKVATKKTTSRIANPQAAQNLPGKIPTKLPSFRGPKRAVVDFEKDSGTHINTVVVRTPLPLEQALLDDKAAAQEIKKAQLNSASNSISKPVAKPNTNSDAELFKAELKTELANDRMNDLSDDFESSQLGSASTPMIEPIAAQSQPSTSNSTASASDQTLVGPPKPSIPYASAQNTSASLTQPQADPTPFVGPMMPGSQPELTPYVGPVTRLAKTSSVKSTNSLTANQRLILRGSYLDARYDQLESRLQNGASSFGLAVGSSWVGTEARLGIDVVHGLDQTVTVQNTRMLMVRGELLQTFLPGSGFQPFVGGTLGVSDFNVNSTRSVGAGAITIREHARGTALAGSALAGIRLSASEVSLDLQAEFLGLLGNEQASKLGGGNFGAAISVSF